MKIFSVRDGEFKPYGRIVNGMEDTVNEILHALKSTPLPEGTEYVAEEPILQQLPAAKTISDHLFGGMPCQVGWCSGHNTKLNCLEYHRDSEFNLGTEEFVLLLAKQDDIENGMLNTARVKAFLAPAGTLLEIYATTLHYAPCHINPQSGFQVMVALPKGTNLEKPDIRILGGDDECLWAQNKWLLAHPDAEEAKAGAYIGLIGKNIDIAQSH